MLFLCFFCTVTLGLYAVFVLGDERRQHLKRRVARLADAAPGPGGDAGGAALPPESEGSGEEVPAPGLRFAPARLLRSAGRLLWAVTRRQFSRRLTEARASQLELRLLQAGRPLAMGAVEYRLLQGLLLLGLPVLFGLYAAFIGAGAGGTVLFTAMGLGIAAVLPGYYLRLKTKARVRGGLRELPDVLDMLTVSLEAGLGFDGALSKLVAKSDGVLCGEFRRCLEEIRLGRTRREALSGIRDRLPLAEIKVLISSILQAEKLGIGMVQVLRVQSQEVREQRRQRAEEEAMKAPIKMLFPLILFIFPTLFIVLLGPAVIQFLEAFSK